MIKKLMFVMMLFPMFMVGQESEVYKTLDAIKARGLERGIDLNELIDIHLDTIVVVAPEYFGTPKNELVSEVLGRVEYLKTVKGKWVWEIKVSTAALDDEKVLERVIAHELGHTLHILKHCCEADGEDYCANDECLEIMGLGHVTDKTNFFYGIQFHPFESIKFWDRYFEQIVIENDLNKEKVPI